MDKAQFEKLFKTLYPELCRYAYSLVKDQQVSEDIVQELFIYLWENKSNLNIKSFQAYLYKSVKNKAINYLKSYGYINVQELSASIDKHQSTDNTSNELQQKELRDILQRAMKKLPSKCYEVFYLKKFEELSNKEIAEKLSISVKTVENHFTIAIKKISAYLNLYWNQ
ncbi:MAG: RNA polymerase sigma-70 factor [Bacteroidales bacterium]|nr:RNA polymerase sigma-70 factor [Bacteroidales bacterium]